MGSRTQKSGAGSSRVGGPPKNSMFTEHLYQHGLKQVTLRDSIERSKKEALDKTQLVADLLVDSVNTGVQQVFKQEQQVEVEVRTLAVAAQRFSTQMTAWVQMFEEFDGALKEIGDFENWVATIDYDACAIRAALEHIKAQKAPS